MTTFPAVASLLGMSFPEEPEETIMGHQSSPPGTGLRVTFAAMHISLLEHIGIANAGGMNVLTTALARALGRLGVRVDFLTRRTDLNRSEREDATPSVTLRRLLVGPSTPPPESEIGQHVDESRKTMEALGPHDLIHSHHWMSGVATLPVTRAQRAPHMMTSYSVVAYPNSPLRDGESPESSARVSGEAVYAEQSDLILCTSRHEAAMVIDCRGADPERARTVYPGADVDLLHPAAHPWASPRIRPDYVVFAAWLQPLKASDVAIRTMACLPDVICSDLTVVGETPANFTDYEAELHTPVDDPGLHGQMHFLPNQNHKSLIRITRHASVMLVSSHSETFGLIALEVSASGVPVLVATSGGLTEAVCNTHTGLLIPTRDSHMWAETPEALLANESCRRLLGAIRRQRAPVVT